MIFSRAFKLRFRRRFRVQQKQVALLGQQAEAELERDLFRRFERVSRRAWRFVGSWVALLVLLIGCLVAQTRALNGYFQTLQAVPGGSYSEGVVGTFRNANPMYATSAVDTTVSKLLFASLFTYDGNNNLVGDLASSWSANARGTVYTVQLKPHLTWQDGQPLTSADVAYTYRTIQNPDAQSPFQSGWADIKVATPSATAITFTLPNPLTAFPYSLTTGIVPQHILARVPIDDLRSAPFNTVSPVGAGPFAWRTLQVSGNSTDNQTEQIALRPFKQYYGGAPKLDSFVVHTFRKQSDMVASFQKQEITAMAGLSDVPSVIQKDGEAKTYSFPLTAAVMTFFQTTQGVLADSAVRHALVQAADTNGIMQSLGYPTKPVREPLLLGQFGYNASYAQAGFNLGTANAALDAAGWVRGHDGVRTKAKQRLSFALYAPDTTEYTSVAKQLHAQWLAVGADVHLVLQDETDFQSTLTLHTYDALLYGISVGVDPDVYAYWDSSQAKPSSPTRLNFSNYQSAAADASLEAGRTRANSALRAIKYQAFLQAWQADAPALGLYQPRFLYVTHGEIAGLNEHTLNSDTDRFDNVQNWMMRRASVSQDQ